MLGYASNTGTRRNLKALREAGWGILVTPEKPKPPDGFRYGIDCGAWGCSQRNEPFGEAGFMRLVERHGANADFIVIPDIVAGGMKSFSFSCSWMDYLKPWKAKLLLPLQDGMTPEIVGAFLRQNLACGLFLGGGTEWKLKTMYAWGMVAHAHWRHYHVGRVNTVRRIQLAEESGADSFDGTSASRYAETLPLLDAARRQPRLFTARTSSVFDSYQDAWEIVPRPEPLVQIQQQEGAE